MRIFYGHLIEQAENCSLGDEETTFISRTFKLNMQDVDTQRERLKKTVSPTKALEVAVHIEMGAQNQQKINQNLNINAQLVNVVNNFQGHNCKVNYQQPRKDFTRYPTVLQTTKILASVLIVVSAGTITTAKFVPRVVRNTIITEL